MSGNISINVKHNSYILITIGTFMKVMTKIVLYTRTPLIKKVINGHCSFLIYNSLNLKSFNNQIKILFM